MIYFVQNGDAVKIGYSANPDHRLGYLQTGSPHPLRSIAVIEGDCQTEASIHRRFEHLRIRGEWFRLDDEIMSFIAENAHPHRTIVAERDPIGSLCVCDCEGVSVEINEGSVYVHAKVGGKIVTLLRAPRIKSVPDVQDRRSAGE